MGGFRATVLMDWGGDRGNRGGISRFGGSIGSQ